MKVIVAGSRTISNYNFVKKAIELSIEKKGWEITEVVCGMAKGVDTFGMRWAYENNVQVNKKPADWDLHGKAAGFIRNKEMAQYADACIVLYDGKSRGSANMIKQAKEHGLDTVVFLEEEVRKMVNDEELPIQKAKLISHSLPDTVPNSLPSDQKIARLEKRIDTLEQEVGHLKTLIKARSSKRYGK